MFTFLFCALSIAWSNVRKLTLLLIFLFYKKGNFLKVSIEGVSLTISQFSKLFRPGFSSCDSYNLSLSML